MGGTGLASKHATSRDYMHTQLRYRAVKGIADESMDIRMAIKYSNGKIVMYYQSVPTQQSYHISEIIGQTLLHFLQLPSYSSQDIVFAPWHSI